MWRQRLPSDSVTNRTGSHSPGASGVLRQEEAVVRVEHEQRQLERLRRQLRPEPRHRLHGDDAAVAGDDLDRGARPRVRADVRRRVDGRLLGERDDLGGQLDARRLGQERAAELAEERDRMAAVREQRDRDAGLRDDAQERGLPDRPAVVPDAPAARSTR